jgi:glucosamine-6-phosphate deaminase
MSIDAAAIIAAQLAEKNNSNFGLAWGSSPIGCYREVADYCSRQISFSKAKVFAIDEYLGNRAIGKELLEKTLYNHIDLPEFSRFSPTMVDDYDGLIEDLGGLDMLLLGFGRNGHVAACEPGTPFWRQTHLVQLATETIEDNFQKYNEYIRFARTIGPSTIMRARKIVLLIAGEQKRTAAALALFGPVTEAVPASILQLHPDVTVLCDFRLEAS